MLKIKLAYIVIVIGRDRRWAKISVVLVEANKSGKKTSCTAVTFLLSWLHHVIVTIDYNYIAEN